MDSPWSFPGASSPLGIAVLALLFAAIIVFVTLWVTLPLAVYGLKSTLRELLEAQREANRRLEGIEGALKAQVRAETTSGLTDPDRPELHRPTG